MTPAHQGRPLRAALALLALVLAGLAFAATASVANAQSAKKTTERLVIRGQDVVKDAPCAPPICEMQLEGGTFRGTPVGTGSYTGSVKLDFANVYPNGEGGLCAPIRADVVLGAGTPDRLAIVVRGDSCQDGAGNPATSSFTATGMFAIKYGTGAYAKAHGGGLFTSSEDANDHERMTLIGRITR
jgi:hypothetical protein